MFTWDLGLGRRLSLLFACSMQCFGAELVWANLLGSVQHYSTRFNSQSELCMISFSPFWSQTLWNKDESTVSPCVVCSPVLPVLTASVLWFFSLHIYPLVLLLTHLALLFSTSFQLQFYSFLNTEVNFLPMASCQVLFLSCSWALALLAFSISMPWRCSHQCTWRAVPNIS